MTPRSRTHRRTDAGTRRALARLALAAALATSVAGVAPVARAQGESVAEADDAAKARAQELYKSAALSYEFRRWDDALRKFRESYAVVRSPNTHLMIARVLAEQGQPMAAYNELVATEAEARAEGERYAETATRASELRETLARNVALLVIEVDAGSEDPAAATVLVAGSDHPRALWGAPVAMKPGPVEIVGRHHGAERTRQKVSLAVGSVQRVRVALAAGAAPDAVPPPPLVAATAPPADPPDDGGSLVPLIAVSAGVGAGGLALFTVFGLMNHSTYDTLEKRCAAGCDRASIAEDVDEGETQQTVANVGLVIGALGVAAATTLLIVELTDDDGSGDTSAARLLVGPTGVTAAGSF